MSDVVITVHEKQIEWLRKMGAKRVIPLMYGVDLDLYLPETPPPNAESNDSVTVGYSGGFYRHHGAHLLLKAISLVHQEYPNVQFQIAGNAPNDIRESYASSKTKFQGLLPIKEYMKFLKSTDILVCPPHPPFPNVSIVTNKLMDYLASARPVVGTNTGAIGQLLEKWDAGVSVPPSPQGVATGIVQLIKDPSRRKRQGQNALKLAREKFDWNKNSCQIFEILKRYSKKK